MDIAGKMFEVSIGIYQYRLESSLKKMAGSPTLFVVISGITDVEPLYRSA